MHTDPISRRHRHHHHRPDGETISLTGTATVAQTFENVIVGQTSPADTVTPPTWITNLQGGGMGSVCEI